MMLWIVLALLTVAVAAALMRPLLRGSSVSPAEAGDVEVYRDQLGEIDRDRDQGLIGAEEAGYARAEVGRRLLAAASLAKSDAQKPRKSGRHRLALAIVVVLPPALGLCLYLALGNPELPDQPLLARLANPGNNIELLVTKAERHLAENPNDSAGWELLAPIYMRMNRFGDAELAFRNAIRLSGENAARLSGLGEALVAESQGVVTDDARSAFEQSAKLDPANPRPRFYIGLGQEQAGKADAARGTFEQIARESPPDAPWMAMVNDHIAKNGGKPVAAPAQDAAAATAPGAQALGGPTTADVTAAQGMSAGDRQAMIKGMVDTLAEKLKDDPNNIEGWLRLVRSYGVLGDKDKAADALKNGLAQFPPNGDQGRRLVALAGEMGLTVDGASTAETSVKE